MNIRIFLVLAATSLIYGCSDENKEVRGEFLAGCVQSGAPKSICSCTFEKLEEKYTPAELKRFNRPMANPPESFLKDVMASALACRN